MVGRGRNERVTGIVVGILAVVGLSSCAQEAASGSSTSSDEDTSAPATSAGASESSEETGAQGSTSAGAGDAATSESSDGSSSTGDSPDPGGLSPEEQQAIDDNWALRVTRAIEAWQLLRERGVEPGEGVLIAHPDTGISFHPELLETDASPSPIRWDLAYDFVADDPFAVHGFGEVLVPGHGHGTETSSVIVSALGCPPGFEPDGPCVTGAAPAAQLIPYRVSNAVVLLSGDLVADAVDRAIEVGAHVISISMGGVTPMDRLETSIATALASGIIVVAAAGNGTGPVVVAPSTMEGVVSVAGVTPDLEPWSTSARGPRVDISGPAVDVRYARTVQESGELVYSVGLAKGTSDATALTAAAAALWLSYHGREALFERYGPAGVPRVFRALLKEHGYFVPPDWRDNGNWGPGILDMVALLEAPLP